MLLSISISTEILPVFLFVFFLLRQHLLITKLKAGGQSVDGFLPGRVFGWRCDDVVVSQVQRKRAEIWIIISFKMINYVLTEPGGTAGGGHVGHGVLVFTSGIWLRAVDTSQLTLCLNTPLRFRNSTGAGREPREGGREQGNVNILLFNLLLSSFNQYQYLINESKMKVNVEPCNLSIGLLFRKNKLEVSIFKCQSN